MGASTKNRTGVMKMINTVAPSRLQLHGASSANHTRETPKVKADAVGFPASILLSFPIAFTGCMKILTTGMACDR